MAEQKINRKHSSVNADTNNILFGFFKFATTKEKRFDIGLPFAISAIIFVSAYFLIRSNQNLLDIVKDLNSVSLSIMSILAGFNTTSLAVIASTQQKTLFRLFEKNGQKNDKNILEQLLTFFSYSIIIQLILIILGSLLLVMLKYASDLYKNLSFVNYFSSHIILSVVGLIWLGLVLHTLFISIRNVTILYHYVVFIGSEKEQDDESE